MDSPDDLIRWKTDAWKSPAFVQGYAGRMDLQTGPSLLKNRVETGILQRFVTGGDVLDVGVGTGRASLPLARSGKNVTGVDSSQAMLDKCRELACGTPISLALGDVTALPFADRSFDSVISLNTMTHFPHWQQILKEWIRVARPGGQILFDAYSLDHDIAFARSLGKPEEYGSSHFAPKDVASFFLRLRAQDLLDFACENGLRVRALVPYSALFGSAGYNRFFEGTTLQGNSWDRLLSWVGADRKLFDFLAFLEEAVAANLTTTATCRFMAVFDVVDEPRANCAWAKRDREHNQELTGGLRFETFQRFCPGAESIRTQLNAQLSHEPSRLALARLVLADRANWIKDLDAWVDAQYLPQLVHIQSLGRIDELVVLFIKSLSSRGDVPSSLDCEGVALEQALAYDMMAPILNAIGAFDSSFSEKSP